MNHSNVYYTVYILFSNLELFLSEIETFFEKMPFRMKLIYEVRLEMKALKFYHVQLFSPKRIVGNLFIRSPVKYMTVP